jgi:hypothetical protein
LFDNTSVFIACAKGRNTSCSTADNILCAACAEGYVPFGDHGECVACELGNSYTMASVYGLMLVMAMVAVVAMKVRGTTHQRGLHNGLKRTILSHVQMTSIILALNTEWPSTLSVPMRMLTEVMTGAGAASSFSCSLTEPGVLIDGAMLFYLTLTVNALMPVLVALITYAYWIILAPQHRCFRCGKKMLYSSFCSGGCKRCLGGWQRRSERSDSGPHAASKMPLRPAGLSATTSWNTPVPGPSRMYDSDGSNRPVADRISRMSRNKSWSPKSLSQQLRSTRDAWWVTCIYFTYFFFPRNIRLGFQAFECMAVCGQEYLSAEPQEKCWEAGGQHMWWVLCVATPTLIAYVFLLPVATLLYLLQFRRKFHREGNVKKQEKMMFRLGFLYSGYADACWWFDSVVLLRKIFIILFVTFGGRSKYQLHSCMAVLVSMLFVQERLRPYHGERKGAVHLQARAVSMKKMELALARRKTLQNNKTSQKLSDLERSNKGIKHQTSPEKKQASPAMYHMSEEERLSIVRQEDMKERAVYNYLHNVEVASVMILIYLVWIAQYFLMEGSCQKAHTDSAGKITQDTVLLCNVLGAFGVGLNGLFMLWTCSMFLKSCTEYNFKHVRRAQKCCQKVLKRCCCVNICVEPADVPSVIVVQDGLDPMRDIAWGAAEVYSNPMQTKNTEDVGGKKKTRSAVAAEEIGIEMTINTNGGDDPLCGGETYTNPLHAGNTSPGQPGDRVRACSKTNAVPTPYSVKKKTAMSLKHAARGVKLAQTATKRMRKVRRFSEHVSGDGKTYFAPVEGGASVWTLPDNAEVIVL